MLMPILPTEVTYRLLRELDTEPIDETIKLTTIRLGFLAFAIIQLIVCPIIIGFILISADTVMDYVVVALIALWIFMSVRICFATRSGLPSPKKLKHALENGEYEILARGHVVATAAQQNIGIVKSWVESEQISFVFIVKS